MSENDESASDPEFPDHQFDNAQALNEPEPPKAVLSEAVSFLCQRHEERVESMKRRMEAEHADEKHELTQLVLETVRLASEKCGKQIEEDLNAALTAHQRSKQLKSGLGASSNLGSKRTFIQYRGEGNTTEMFDQYHKELEKIKRVDC